MEDLNRRILNGHTMRVGPASKRNPLLSTTNLYIEGVPKEWTDADLRKHFGEFGEIAAARILVDKGSHTSREVGFVHFTNHENALSVKYFIYLFIYYPCTQCHYERITGNGDMAGRKGI